MNLHITRDVIQQAAGFLTLLLFPASALLAQPGDLGPTGTPLFLINADGTGLRQMSGVPRDLAAGSPDWSPDGKKIAFDGWSVGEDGNHTGASVYIKEVGSDEIRKVALGAMPSWSPDGQQIVFAGRLINAQE